LLSKRSTKVCPLTHFAVISMLPSATEAYSPEHLLAVLLPAAAICGDFCIATVTPSAADDPLRPTMGPAAAGPVVNEMTRLAIANRMSKRFTLSRLESPKDAP